MKKPAPEYTDMLMTTSQALEMADTLLTQDRFTVAILLIHLQGEGAKAGMDKLIEQMGKEREDAK